MLVPKVCRPVRVCKRRKLSHSSTRIHFMKMVAWIRIAARGRPYVELLFTRARWSWKRDCECHNQRFQRVRRTHGGFGSAREAAALLRSTRICLSLARFRARFRDRCPGAAARAPATLFSAGVAGQCSRTYVAAVAVSAPLFAAVPRQLPWASVSTTAPPLPACRRCPTNTDGSQRKKSRTYLP